MQGQRTTGTAGRTSRLAWAIGLGLAAVGQVALAGTPALAVGGQIDAPHDPNNPVNLGLVFTVNTNITVDGLGAYFTGDAATSGASETVTLYTIGGSVLASAVVSDLTPATAGYEFASIAPVALTAGTQYVVAAHTGINSWGWSPSSGPVVDSRITLNGTAYSYGSVAFPTSNYGPAAAYYGPNISIAPVPEPETVAMMLAGLGMLGLLAKRRRAG